MPTNPSSPRNAPMTKATERAIWMPQSGAGRTSSDEHQQDDEDRSASGTDARDRRTPPPGSPSRSPASPASPGPRPGPGGPGRPRTTRATTTRPRMTQNAAMSKSTARCRGSCLRHAPSTSWFAEPAQAGAPWKKMDRPPIWVEAGPDITYLRRLRMRAYRPLPAFAVAVRSIAGTRRRRSAAANPTSHQTM